MVSRETETFLFKNTLKRGMCGTAESQGKEAMRVALPFFFFFSTGDKIILLVCLCGKYLLFFPFFLLTHTHVPVHVQT